MPTSRRGPSCAFIGAIKGAKVGDGGVDVGREHLVEHRQVVQPLGEGAVRDAGAGDHDVGAAGMGDEVARRASQRRVVGDIERVDAVQGGIGQAGGQLVEGLAAPPQQAQGGALRGIFAGQRRADAARCAGDEHAVHATVAGVHFRSAFARPTR
jgi:hypothetical protein